MSNAVTQIIEKWPSGVVLAADLGMTSHKHVACIKVRGRIPRAYWHDMVAAAARRGIKGVSLARLEKIHANIGVRRS
jgi:hypothetical protein